ncbi:TetR/AcrR family transcriptional regulator [Mycobacterium noviomagense]|uniref:TetR family transcriptional regulator n=1 Tax=Mycobacterium noviomagense TaxID=459858 RepID=A0A7I7P7L0_9MYCO|nr:TetR/AcrR family transcriptional regulator [Mycobacterium noviomagense]ORB18726.1 TetR family transcriptional regulator [Mycobacterium noviomagense]BBY04873.1 TetR family transcriptional regulator [Mycobacterium noviomagense]
MTDSVRGGNAHATPPGKRERLVAAALELVHRQGVERTTLADIAQAADVPVGNVYYYFKAKDDIVAAVVRTRAQEMESALAELERRHRSPKARLKGLVRLLADRRDSIAQYGCPHGTLCSELAKRSGGSDPPAGPLMQIPIDWAEEQFRRMGRRDAHDLAVELVALYQGSAVLASALREPDLMTRQARRIEKWIDAI